MQRTIDLTKAQTDALGEVLSNFADRFDRIAVYGSRVQGRARKGSDVDLVIYGKANSADVAALRQALEDSDLSIFAGVTVYADTSFEPLRQEIDRWAVDWPNNTFNGTP